jgi:ribonuclease HI
MQNPGPMKLRITSQNIPQSFERWLDKTGQHDTPIILRGDSRLIINQLKGEFKVKSLRIIELYDNAKKLLSRFKNLRMEWVDRDRNQEADRLSRIAYKKYLRENNG